MQEKHHKHETVDFWLPDAWIQHSEYCSCCDLLAHLGGKKWCQEQQCFYSYVDFLFILVYVEIIVQYCSKPVNVSRCDDSTSVLGWIPAQTGTMFINADAALFHSSRPMGVGVLIWDNNGSCVFAFNELIPGIASCDFWHRWSNDDPSCSVLGKWKKGFQKIILAQTAFRTFRSSSVAHIFNKKKSSLENKN